MLKQIKNIDLTTTLLLCPRPAARRSNMNTNSAEEPLTLCTPGVCLVLVLMPIIRNCCWVSITR